MRTKVLLLVAGLFAVGSLLSPAGATAQDDLTKQLASVEKSLWKAWVEGDVAPFQEHLTADHINIGDWGMTTGKDAVLGIVAASPCDVTSYELDDWRAIRLSDDTAVLTFEAEQVADCNGTVIAQEVVASSVYVMQDGVWMNAMYHETPVGDEDEEEEDEDGEDEYDDDGR